MFTSHFLLGRIGGGNYLHHGGGANYLCLPNTPKYDKYKTGSQATAWVFGAEYEVWQFNPFEKNFHNRDAPCAVCFVESLGSMLRCQHGTTVLVNGPRSIMGTWWLNIKITGVKKISSALTKMLSISLAALRTWMVHCCTWWRDVVAHYRVVHMFKVESWLALCAPSEGSKDCPFYGVFQWTTNDLKK